MGSRWLRSSRGGARKNTFKRAHLPPSVWCFAPRCCADELALHLPLLNHRQVGRRSMVVRAESTEFDSEKLIKDLSEKVRARGGAAEESSGVWREGLPLITAVPSRGRAKSGHPAPLIGLKKGRAESRQPRILLMGPLVTAWRRRRR